MALGDGTDRRRQGRREQYGLAGFRHGLEDEFEVVHEAQLEHLVGLVEHQTLNGGQQVVVTAQVIAQAAGGSDEYLGTHAQGLQLRPHGRAAVEGHDLHAGHLGGVGFAGGSDLQGQFTGRNQHQNLGFTTGRVELREQRQSKGCGLARTGLRLANHVVAGEDHRNGLRLDGRRLFVADGLDGGEDGGIEIERSEIADVLGHCLASCASQRPQSQELRLSE